MSPIARGLGRFSRSRAGRRAANTAMSIARTPHGRRKVVELRTRLSRLH